MCRYNFLLQKTIWELFVEFFVGFLEFWIGNMRVDLRCCDWRVSEEFLDNSDVCSVCEEGGCKTVSESVGMEVFEDSCLNAVILYHIGDEESCEAYILFREIGRFDVIYSEIVSYEKRGEVVVPHIDIIRNSDFRPFCQVDDTEFVSFSSNGKFHRLEIDVFLI